MKKSKLNHLSKLDLPPNNIEEYNYFEGNLEKEFEFFKDYYTFFIKLSNGDLAVNEEIYREMFNSSNYWDFIDNFKDVFNSEYHYFMDMIFQEYINV